MSPPTKSFPSSEDMAANSSTAEKSTKRGGRNRGDERKKQDQERMKKRRPQKEGNRRLQTKKESRKGGNWRCRIKEAAIWGRPSRMPISSPPRPSFCAAAQVQNTLAFSLRPQNKMAAVTWWGGEKGARKSRLSRGHSRHRRRQSFPAFLALI